MAKADYELYELWLQYRRGELSRIRQWRLSLDEKKSILHNDSVVLNLVPSETLQNVLMRLDLMTAETVLRQLPITRAGIIQGLAEFFKIPYEVNGGAAMSANGDGRGIR